MGVSRSASREDRSKAGALKASFTPSKSPIFRAVDCRVNAGTLEKPLATPRRVTLEIAVVLIVVIVVVAWVKSG